MTGCFRRWWPQQGRPCPRILVRDQGRVIRWVRLFILHHCGVRMRGSFARRVEAADPLEPVHQLLSLHLVLVPCPSSVRAVCWPELTIGASVGVPVFPALIPVAQGSHTIPFRIGPHVGPPWCSHRTICKSVEAAMHQQPPRFIIIYHTWRPVMRVLPAEWLLHCPWLCWFILYVAQAESRAECLLSRSCSCRNTFTPDTGGA